MRTFIIILTLFLQGIPSDAVRGESLLISENNLSVFSEEISASWERKADADIMGERVTHDFTHKKNGGLTVNSLCSEESIVKLNSIRKFATDIIAESSESKNSNTGTYIAAVMLRKVAAMSFTSLTEKESWLISSAEKLSLSVESFTWGGFSSNSSTPAEFGAFNNSAVFTISKAVKLRGSHDKNSIHNLSIKKITCSSERFDREFADFYRLFLYVRDNSGNRKHPQMIFYNGLHRSIRLIINSIQCKSSDKTNIKISQGASS